MGVTPGTRLGLFEVTGRLGAGGMGEVYRARDSRLGREVALKILPEPFAVDADRVSRFEREARILACLNHPRIATLYGLEESSSVRALVIELVNGPTLAERIAEGPLPLADVLRISRQIVDALECAHAQGIVHRDLKPANIKIDAAGDVKVLDFGLAKMLQPGTAPDESAVATQMRSMPGSVLGTAAYMAPEQAKGQDAGPTADIWAFGCVLYEMLARHPAFRGASASEILSEVLKSEPDWRELPPQTPAPIRRLLFRCLQKDPRRRLRDIADARFDIADAEHEPVAARIETTVVQPIQPSARTKERIVWGVALLTALAAIGALLARRSTAAPSASELRVEVSTLASNSPTSFAISPDGQKLAFAGRDSGAIRLWVRALDATAATPLSGTESAESPFWSPDGRSIGFFAEGALKRIDIDTGIVKVLAPVAVDRGGSWSGQGTILFTRNYTSPLYRVPATGGDADVVTQVARDQGGHRAPQFLPDGKHFLFYASGGGPEVRGIFVGQLDSTAAPTFLCDADAGAVFVPSGYLLLIRGGVLFAQRFDAARLQLVDAPVQLAQPVVSEATLPAVSASAQGTILWRPGSAANATRRNFAWVDRLGRELQRYGEATTEGRGLQLSPDGKRLVFFQTISGGNVDLWTLDIERSVSSRFTFDPANDALPVFSPDSQRVLFSSNRNGGVHNFYLKSVGGGPGTEQLFMASPQAKQANDWSADGKFVVFRSQDPRTSFDLWALPMAGEQKPFPIARTPFEERDAQFSPDGRWIAYQSNESGRVEIYVQAFPGPGARTQVSVGGGAQVRWNRNGRELFYIGLDERLMAVPIAFSANDQPSVQAPIPLFVTRIGGALQSNFPQQYAVAPDGQRFLMNIIPDDNPTPLTVLVNWKNGR